MLNDQILELNAEKIELSDEKIKLTTQVQQLETQSTEAQSQVKDLTQKFTKIESQLNESKELNENLQKKLSEKTTEFDNMQYEKFLLDEEMRLLMEANENSQMEIEDYLVILERLQQQNEEYKSQDEEMEKVKSKLNNMMIEQESIENSHNSMKDKITQTDQNCEDKNIMTDPVDYIPDMNDVSLVNTLTTSLGGIATQNNLNNIQGLAFAPSPDRASSGNERERTSSNKLKNYLRSNKAKNRAILEEESDMTRISYTTKAANAPKGYRFPLRASDTSPAEITKPYMNKRQKDLFKRKKKFKKNNQNNFTNESKRDSISSNKSRFDHDDQEMLKSIYAMMSHENNRPMTGQPLEIVTSGTKYDEDELRDSIINIDKSDDSEFMKAQIFMRHHNRDPARGWSSKPRPRNQNFIIREVPVKLKKQPIDAKSKASEVVMVKNASNVMSSSQVYSRPVTSNMSGTSKLYGKGSIRNLIRIATSQK